MRLLTILILSLTLASIVGLSIVYACTANRMVTYINIPPAPGPNSSNRNLQLNATYSILVLGNVSLSKKCIDLTNIVERYPLFGLFKKNVNLFDVKLCTLVSHPKAILYYGKLQLEIPQGKTVTLKNVGGKTLRLVYLEEAGTYLEINVLIVGIDRDTIFEGYTYIPLSQAWTCINNNTGLLEGYAYAISAFPQEIVDLAYAIINRYLPYDFWGLTSRSLLYMLDVFDFIALASTVGLKSRTLAAACVGNVCVVCRASWNAVKELMCGQSLEALSPERLIDALNKSSTNCVIVNKTSGKVLNVHQRAKLITYIYEVFNNIAKSYRINLVTESCNRYYCIIGFKEKYPIPLLNLDNIKPQVTALYTLISYGVSFFNNIPPYNATLYVREKAKVAYRYSHVISVRTLALVPLLSIYPGNVTYHTRVRNIETTLLTPSLLVFSKKSNRYYIYYVDGKVNIKVPTVITTKDKIDYYGQKLTIRYTCRLYNVTDSRIIKVNGTYAIVQINASRDVDVRIYYKCQPVTPIPYLKKISWSIEGSKALVEFQIEDLGGPGNVTLVLQPGNITRTVKLLPNKLSSITFTVGSTSSISISYHGIIIGACRKIKISLIPIPENIGINNTLSDIEKTLRNGTIPRYTVPTTIAKAFIIIASSNITNIEELELNSISIPCKDIETINNETIYLCMLENNKSIEIGSIGSYVKLETANGVILGQIINSRPQILKIVTGWIDTEHLQITILIRNVLPNIRVLVLLVGNNKNIVSKGAGTVNNEGKATIVLPVNPILLNNNMQIIIIMNNYKIIRSVTVLPFKEWYNNSSVVYKLKTISLSQAQYVLPRSCYLRGNSKEIVICLPGYAKKIINVTPS